MAASREDWERAGRLLTERRTAISPRYASRKAFADDAGLNWRLVYDAERGRRDTFRPETVRAFESAYRLVPGSLGRTLAGGPLEPAREETAAVVPLSLDDEETVARAIMDLPSPAGGLVPWEERREMIRSLFDRNDRRRAEAGLPSP